VKKNSNKWITDQAEVIEMIEMEATIDNIKEGINRMIMIGLENKEINPIEKIGNLQMKKTVEDTTKGMKKMNEEVLEIEEITEMIQKSMMMDLKIMAMEEKT